MSLVEYDFRTELAVHYAAVRLRLRTPRPAPAALLPVVCLPPAPPRWAPPQELPEPKSVTSSKIEAVAAKWREIDERIFGGRVSPKSAILVISAYFDIDIKTLTSGCRTARIVRARRIAMYVMHRLCFNPLGRISNGQVAKHFCRDHASVFHADGYIAEKLRTDQQLATEVGDIMSLLQRGKK